MGMEYLIGSMVLNMLVNSIKTIYREKAATVGMTVVNLTVTGM
jgi:hypothetical protein